VLGFNKYQTFCQLAQININKKDDNPIICEKTELAEEATVE